MSAARFAIPSRPSHMPALALVMLTTCLVAGCRSSSSPSQETEPMEPAGPPPQVEMGWEERPLGGVASRIADPVPVKEGPAPLVYLTESGVTIRIVDRTSEKSLAELAVSAHTIVRVDQRAGIAVGKQTLIAGPLPAGRKYAIMVVPTGESVSRSGRTRQVEPPPAQQAPQAEPVEEQPPERVVDPTGTGAQSK